MTTPQDNIPYGFCHCGCGQKTNLAPQTESRKRIRKGEPFRFVHGHNRSGMPVSFECKQKTRAANTTHGHTKNGVPTSTFTIWFGMLQRCYNPKRKFWDCYGGRGITVCERWRKFENFLSDMGTRPPGLTIERIDNDGNYEPGNCKWATWSEQNRNKRRRSVNRRSSDCT